MSPDPYHNDFSITCSATTKIPPKEKTFVNTEITGDDVCPKRAEIKDVLKELTAIHADMVAVPKCHGKVTILGHPFSEIAARL